MAYTDLRMDNHWLPFTANRHFKQAPRVIVGAEGMYMRTAEGRQVPFQRDELVPVPDGVADEDAEGTSHDRPPSLRMIRPVDGAHNGSSITWRSPRRGRDPRARCDGTDRPWMTRRSRWTATARAR